MDSGEGRFEEFEKPEQLADLQREYPLHGGVFKKGEILEIRGSKFKIKTISPKELRLKLLPKHSKKPVDCECQPTHLLTHQLNSPKETKNAQ